MYGVIISHFLVTFAVPRTHGNSGRLPHNTHRFDTYEYAAQFILSYAESSGLPDPSSDSIYLPANENKTSVHRLYYEACIRENLPYLSRATFSKFWCSSLSSVKFLSIHTDMCGKCTRFKDKIKCAVGEQEKEEIISAFSNHLDVAKSKRQFRDSDGNQQVPWRNWSAMLSQHMRPLPGISKYYVFKMSADTPG